MVAGQTIVWHQCLELVPISWLLITELANDQNIHEVLLAPFVQKCATWIVAKDTASSREGLRSLQRIMLHFVLVVAFFPMHGGDCRLHLGYEVRVFVDVIHLCCIQDLTQAVSL